MNNGVTVICLSIILTLRWQHKFASALADNARMPEELDKLPDLSYEKAITAPPEMIIRSWRFVEILPTHRQINKGDMNVTCSAPYPIKFGTNIKAEVTEQSISVSADASNWTATLKFWYPLAGFIACEPFPAANSSNFTNKVQIFLDIHARTRSYGRRFNLETWFTYSKRERIFPIKSDQQELHYLAPCRLNFLKMATNVTPQPTVRLDGGPQLHNIVWEPTSGMYFQLPQGLQHHNWAICTLGKEETSFFLVKRVDIKTIPTVQFLENEMRITNHSMTVDLEGELVKNMAFRQSVFWCRWASSCFERLPVDYNDEARDQPDLTYELSTHFEEPKLAQGIVKYILAPAPIPHGYDDFLYFTGLDNVIYKLNEGAYSNASVVQLDPFKLSLYKNDTLRYEFTCKVLDFVLAPRVYLQVVMENTTSNRLLSSGIILTQEARKRVTEYSFELELDVNMRKIECLGIDAYFGIWRSSGRDVEVKYTYAPRVTAHVLDGSERSFVKGGNYTLDCPISGEPRVEISWNSPQMVAGAVTNEKTLKLGPVNESYAGNYTCYAVNPYGRASYTTIVRVVDPQLSGVGPTVIVVTVVSIILVVLVVVLAWKYYSAKKKMGGLTEKQIEGYLQGDQTVAQSMPEGPEKAKAMEFAKFISPKDLSISFDEILGEGQYGIVYSGSYGAEPVAIKAFKLPLLNAEQIFAALTEIKLMGYIGDHPNIVQFHGVDISGLRRGQMYMVMEKSYGGSLLKHLAGEACEKFSEIKQMEAYEEELEKLLQSLVGFCVDIASAMEYLEERKIIHGDLATRNVLLFPGNVAKLADFGYARRLYVGTEYVPHNTDELMIAYRWASIELLKNAAFSTASDVWAFGVTAWEIFTLGETPFLGRPFNDFCQMLEEGMRLRKPELACDQLYDILQDCWKPDPADRPSFKFLRERLGELAKCVVRGNLNFCIEPKNVIHCHQRYENLCPASGVSLLPTCGAPIAYTDIFT